MGNWNIRQSGDFVLDDGQAGATGGAVVPAISFGRGTTDTDITFITMRNAAGTIYYLYVSATGALTVASARP